MYLVLKMPGPKGIITIKGGFKLSDLCEKEFHKLAQNFSMMANYRAPKDKAKSSITGTAQQLEAHPAKPEVKKPRVQPSKQDKPTGEEEKTLAA
jgi:hypothetical protein